MTNTQENKKCEAGEILLFSEPERYRCVKCQQTWEANGERPACHQQNQEKCLKCELYHTCERGKWQTENQEKNVLTDITPERLAELEKAGVKVAKIENQESEWALTELLKGLNEWVFVESTDTSGETYKTTQLNPRIEDQEAVIVIKGEWDREDLKKILANLLSNQKSSLVESLAEMTKDKMDESLRQDILALLKRD